MHGYPRRGRAFPRINYLLPNVVDGRATGRRPWDFIQNNNNLPSLAWLRLVRFQQSDEQIVSDFLNLVWKTQFHANHLGHPWVPNRPALKQWTPCQILATDDEDTIHFDSIADKKIVIYTGANPQRGDEGAGVYILANIYEYVRNHQSLPHNPMLYTAENLLNDVFYNGCIGQTRAQLNAVKLGKRGVDYLQPYGPAPPRKRRQGGGRPSQSRRGKSSKVRKKSRKSKVRKKSRKSKRKRNQRRGRLPV
jgi:hypothetical protein